MAITAILNGMVQFSGMSGGASPAAPLPTGIFTSSVSCKKVVTLTSSFQSLATLLGAIPTGTTGVAVVPQAANVANNNISAGISGTVASVLAGGTNPLPWILLAYDSGITQGLQMTGSAAANLSVEILLF